MKKIYTKPYIAVESFQLDAAIAASCTPTKGSLGYTVNDCTLSDGKGVQMPNAHIIGPACTSDGVSIDIISAGSDANDYYCYHGPTIDVNTLFMNS